MSDTPGYHTQHNLLSSRPGRANLDEIFFTLAVNFLMYVVLIIVFYMFARFYLEEQTSIDEIKFRENNGIRYTLVSTEDNIELEDNHAELFTPSPPFEDTNITTGVTEIQGNNPSSSNADSGFFSPRRYLVSFFGNDSLDEDDNARLEQISKVIVCAVGLNTIFGIWGLLQERILTQTYDGDFFEYSYGLVFINRLLGFIFSAYLMYHFQITWIQSPMWEYSIPSVANMYVLCISFSSTSMFILYLNFEL